MSKNKAKAVKSLISLYWKSDKPSVHSFVVEMLDITGSVEHIEIQGLKPTLCH